MRTDLMADHQQKIPGPSLLKLLWSLIMDRHGSLHVVGRGLETALCRVLISEYLCTYSYLLKISELDFQLFHGPSDLVYFNNQR